MRLPASGGTSANSAGCEIANTTPSRAVSTRTGAVPVVKPSTTATTAPNDEIAASSRVASARSTSRPACPATATDGPNRQIHRAATANPESVMSLTWSPSATIATQSPSADSPTEPATSRKSRLRSRLPPVIAGGNLLAEPPFTHEPHEVRAGQGADPDQPAWPILEQGDILAPARTHRVHEPAARGELVRQRLRDAGKGRGDDDRVVRRVLGEAERPVA